MPMERLSWRNRFVKELVQELNDYSEADCEGKTPQTISGPDNLVILRVSFEEWEKLFSSTYTGADICYPEESDSVRWILQRAVECPVDICELIINCINNNPATMQAIIDKLKESEEFNDYLTERALGVTSGGAGGTVMESCDNSILAGQIIEAIDTMDTTNADFLQQVELGTNDEERVVAIISGIPGAGVLPADEILDAIQRLLEDFTENYASAVTLEWKDEVSRDLYCLAKQDPECKLTFAQIFEYFQNRAGSTLSLQSILQNIFEFLVNGDFGTDELVASGMFALQVGFMVAGGTFAGMNIPLLTAIARDAEPSNRWETWASCTPGPRWPLTYGVNDFSGQTLTFMGRDGDWDLWEVEAVDCPETIMMSNGQTYTHGWNVKRVGDLPLQIEKLDTNTDWCLWLNMSGGLLNAANFDNSAPYILIAQGCTLSNLTCTFRVKAPPP